MHTFVYVDAALCRLQGLWTSLQTGPRKLCYAPLRLR